MRIGKRADRPRPPRPAEPPSGWIRPWWAERQLDPNSAAYAPAPSQVRYWNSDDHAEASVLANTLGRSWTTVGLPETLERAEVDPRGLVVCGGWSLDWWVRSGEEWAFPSRASSVRQRLVDGMPVVETILRIGGGDVSHRVAAARGAAVQLGDAERHVTAQDERALGDGASAVPEVLVIEIANRTPAPAAVALAARPCHLGAFEHEENEIWQWSNAWGIDEILIDGRVMTLGDGYRPAANRAVVVFDRVPGDVVVGSHGIDCAAGLESSDGLAATGQASAVPVSIGSSPSSGDPASTPEPERGPISATCPQRLANAAAVFPLVAGATLRAAVVGRGSPFEWDDDGSPALGAAVLEAVPGLERVANGWRQRVDAGCRIELPSGRLADAALSARASQLLATAPFDDGPGVVGPMLASALATDFQFAGDDLVQLLALIESGAPEQVRDLLLRQAQAQFPSGETSSMGVSVTGTSLVLADHLLSLHPNPAFAETIGEFAASAARWLLTRDAAKREESWTIREGLRAGYRLLLRNGAERAANALRHEAMSLSDPLHTDVRGAASLPAVSRDRRRAGRRASGRRPGISGPSSFYRDALGRVPWEASWDDSPAPPSQRWEWLSHDTGLWVHAAVPWAPPLPFVTPEPAEGTPIDFVADTAASCGHDLVATALLAFAEARPAPERSFDRLEALLSVASSTLNWPTFMDPTLRTGTNGTGHDLMVGGLFVRALLCLLVDVPDDGTPYETQAPTLRLAAHWPSAWLGQPVEVHDVPTRIGRVSWAVRWHGERPALLWEVTPHRPGSSVPTVTAPGLDPSFATTGWQGETLLEPPAPPTG
ncbi:hypothetical protein [Candidatus Poriferisodalis sp.]|uniref:hypothetical protein n=1 Tax=Candidatus Poriferisodalis sp. TaxID=3101277 RepID=UPI003B012913